MLIVLNAEYLLNSQEQEENLFSVFLHDRRWSVQVVAATTDW